MVNEGKQLFCQKLAVHGAAGVIEVLMRIAGAEYQLKREQHVQCFLQCRAFFIRSCSFALVKMVKRHALVI